MTTTPTPAERGLPSGDWPEYVMLRDTKLHDDMGGLGQRIFTTAGAGYTKVKYVREDLARPLPSDWVAGAGLEEFTEYFVKNYPGPNTIIYDPKWHAPRIFRAAQHAMLAAAPSAPAEGGEDGQRIGVCCYGGRKTKESCASCTAWKPAPEPLAQGALPVCGDEAWAIRRPDGRVELVSIRATEGAAQWAIGSWPQMQRDGFTCERIAIYPYASPQPAAEGQAFVTVPRELTTSMLEAAEQEDACGNDFSDMWEAAIATYLFDKENGNG